MQDRRDQGWRDAGPERCRTDGIRIREKDRRDQDTRDAGQEGSGHEIYRTGGMQDRRVQDRRDAGPEGSGQERCRTGVMKERRESDTTTLSFRRRFFYSNISVKLKQNQKVF